MTSENRMWFIRNMEALENGDAEYDVKEYEVIADARIVGELTHGPYYFTIWEISDKREGEERKLCLRIGEKVFSNDEQPWKSATRSGFYHGGGIGDELVALASLFLRRRFKLGPIVRWDDSPRLLSMSEGWIDKPLVAGQSNLVELSEWLNLIEGLDSTYHQRFILAAKLYHQALLLIEQQPDIAYLNLVSAIEVLSGKTEIKKPLLSDLDAELGELVQSVENEKLRSQIEQAILKRQPFHRRRFVAFILDHIEEDFWLEEKRPEQGRIDRDDLGNLLRRIYDQRSATLHDGKPFPATVFHPPMMGAEIDFGDSIIVGEKAWESKDFVPYPQFFERLVNHVLKSFVKRNQVRGENKGIGNGDAPST